MTHPPEAPSLTWITTASQVDKAVRDQLVVCWRDVSNAGGAVGFPFLPVDTEQVRCEVDALVESLGPLASRLLLAQVDKALAGWLLLVCTSNRLTAHWGRVLRVQTALGYRGRGVGRALMNEVRRAAREDVGLD